MDADKTVASQGDDRTANNAVRHQYRKLSDTEKARMRRVKDSGAAFLGLIDEVGDGKGSRELLLARTKIEEAVMWTVKHITG